MADSLYIRFWGTRGSMVPYCPGRAFGNHTTCVEFFTTPDHPVFVDLGSGAVPASAHAIERGVREFDVHMTHLHSDHVIGCFGFKPFYRDDCTVRVHAARNDLEDAMRHLFHSPFHPVPFDALKAQLNLIVHPRTGRIEDTSRGLEIAWVQVPHPQGCVAYRFDDGTNAVVFATDVELGKHPFTNDLAELLATPYPAGLAIVDGFYTPREIEAYTNWGHSTWHEALDIAQRVGVDNVVVTHHHPTRTDDQLEALAEQGRPAAWAREGTTWTLTNNTPAIAAP